MHLYDKEGMPITITTRNKVYVNATDKIYVNGTEGKVIKLYTRTFEHFYHSLSDKEIASLWKLAIVSLGLDEYPEYQSLLPFNFNFLLEEEETVKPVIWKYLMVAVGYPKYEVKQLDYETFANRHALLGFERVHLNKGDAEHDAYEYLLSVRPNDRVEGCVYNELDLRGVKYVMFDLDDKKLPIMVFANNPEDTNPFFDIRNQIMIRQPKGYLENQFEITDGGNVYDVTYNMPKD